MVTAYNTKRGKIAKTEIGVVTRRTIRVPKSTDPIIAIIRNVLGNLSSITSISLLNLFIIRPTGVVSKKDIGDLNIQCSPLS